MSVKLSAPQSMTQTAIMRLSSNSWRCAGPVRGSAMMAKWSFK
jgi:hypothetical protein